MINFDTIDDKYFLYSDKDIGKYGPFEAVRIRGIFKGKEFDIGTLNLKSWKNCVGVWQNKRFLFEEKDGKLIFIGLKEN